MSPARRHGPALWAMLHGYDCRDPVRGRAWLVRWEALVGVRLLGCACLAHWRAVKRSIPPDFSSPEAFHLWSCLAHDAVNLRLVRPADAV